MSDYYTIRAGRTSFNAIPSDGFRVPNIRPAFSLTLRDGREDEDWQAYTVHVVAEIATRLTPWATWYASPDAHDGIIGDQTWGKAWPDHTIWVRSTRHPNDAIETAYHEAYHSVERWLTGDEIEAVRMAFERLPDMNHERAYNAYWCEGSEVRARAFAAWAYYQWLTAQLPRYRRGMPAHERIFTAILRGDIGLRAARRRSIRPELIPDSLRQRLAQRTDRQKLLDAARNAASATWTWIAGGNTPVPDAVAAANKSTK